MVRQGLGRCYYDTVAGMDPYRVEVFHIADGDAVVIAVTHDLVLDFLPASHTALDEHLAYHGVVEAFDDNLNEFFLILCNTAAGTAHGVGRSHDYRVANLIGKGHGRGNILHNGAFRDRLPQLLHGLFEKLTVLGLFNGLKGCTQKLHIVFLQHAFFSQLHSQVQARLSPQGSQQAIRFLLGDDFLQEVHRQRFNIDPVSNMGISHDGSRVGIYQHHFQPFFFQGTAGLRACIVKLCCLADDDGA